MEGADNLQHHLGHVWLEDFAFVGKVSAAGFSDAGRCGYDFTGGGSPRSCKSAGDHAEGKDEVGGY